MKKNTTHTLKVSDLEFRALKRLLKNLDWADLIRLTEDSEAMSNCLNEMYQDFVTIEERELHAHYAKVMKREAEEKRELSTLRSEAEREVENLKNKIETLESAMKQTHRPTKGLDEGLECKLEDALFEAEKMAAEVKSRDEIIEELENRLETSEREFAELYKDFQRLSDSDDYKVSKDWSQ